MTLRSSLLQEVKRVYPDMKSNLAERYVDKYCSAMLKELRVAILRPDNDNVELSFDTTNTRKACGQIKYNNKTQWLFHFMNKSPVTRLVDEKFKGQLGKFKRVILNPLYKEMIMNELIDEPINVLTEAEINELQKTANRVVPLDVVSLRGYIDRSRQELITAQGNYAAKIRQNILFAQEILSNAVEYENEFYAYESWVTSDCGREYGRFNSLQRLPKEVRHAALGVCHKYDFQAHSFAVMASIAKSLNPEIKIAGIEDFIKYRQAYRNRIAQEVGVSPEVIKRVFTALGFGAKAIRNPYNSISKLFYSKEKYDALLAQKDFCSVKEDLALINKTILEHKSFSGDNFTSFNGYVYNAERENEKKRNANQKLAWIYQNSESFITKIVVDYVKEQTGQEPLLTVHDCIYYKQKLSNSVFLDLHTILQYEHEIKFVKLEHEAIFPITTKEQFANRFSKQNSEEQEHQDFISQEEHRARRASNKYNQPLTREPSSRLDSIIASSQFEDYSNTSYSIYGYDKDNDPFYD